MSEEKNNEKKVLTEKFDNIEKMEIRRNAKSHQVKALKALVKIDSHILNMNIDTGSPVSLLNWRQQNKFWKDLRFQNFFQQRS